MVKPNYNFAKRQRELAKKAKKEEKLQRKTTSPEGETDEANLSPDEVEGTSSTAAATEPAKPTQG